MRKTNFAVGEFYHVYNRGVEKRNIFTEPEDVDRFLESMYEFNTLQPIGSLYEKSFDSDSSEKEPLVHFVAYCLNPNHFHFLLEEIVDKGISKYLKRLAGGYSWYFNNKYERSGSLFQGPFKASHINSDEYLLHVSAYVNLNFKCHQLGDQVAKLTASSWNEYTENKLGLCKRKDIILERFENKTDYKKFALSSLEDIIERKKQDKSLSTLLLD